METGDVVDCVVIRTNEHGYLWVQHRDVVGLVAPQDVAWNSCEVPAVGTRVKVVCLFPIDDDATIEFSFVGSINDAHPSKHPINLADDSIIGTRFTSRVLPIGRWIAVKHSCGLFGLLRSDEFTGSVGPDTKVTVEAIGIDRENKRLIVRIV